MGTDASKTEAQAMLDRYTVFSEKYIAVSSETIYQREVMSIVAPGSYMGIWQIFALATVLGRTIAVFYPNRGHLRVTEDMNRLVQPRVERCDTWPWKCNRMMDRSGLSLIYLLCRLSPAKVASDARLTRY